jgi:hypothetical protein
MYISMQSGRHCSRMHARSNFALHRRRAASYQGVQGEGHVRHCFAQLDCSSLAQQPRCGRALVGTNSRAPRVGRHAYIEAASLTASAWLHMHITSWHHGTMAKR